MQPVQQEELQLQGRWNWPWVQQGRVGRALMDTGSLRQVSD